MCTSISSNPADLNLCTSGTTSRIRKGAGVTFSIPCPFLNTPFSRSALPSLREESVRASHTPQDSVCAKFAHTAADGKNHSLQESQCSNAMPVGNTSHYPLLPPRGGVGKPRAKPEGCRRGGSRLTPTPLLNKGRTVGDIFVMDWMPIYTIILVVYT